MAICSRAVSPPRTSAGCWTNAARNRMLRRLGSGEVELIGALSNRLGGQKLEAAARAYAQIAPEHLSAGVPRRAPLRPLAGAIPRAVAAALAAAEAPLRVAEVYAAVARALGATVSYHAVVS